MTLNRKIFIKLAIVVMILSIVVLSFFMFISFSTVMVNTAQKEVIGKEEHLRYKGMFFDTETGKVHETVVVLEEKIGENDYFAGEENGKHYLISNFGSQEFICSGTCYCDEDNSYRRTGKALGTGFRYLFFAVSTLAAYQVAQTRFHDDCVEEFASSCSVSSIEAVVEDCAPVYMTHHDTETDAEEEDSGVVTTDNYEELNEGKYYCEGTCAHSQDYHHELPAEFVIRAKEEIEQTDCESHKMTGYIDASTVEYSAVPGKPEVSAAIHFSICALDTYCKSTHTQYFGNDLIPLCAGVAPYTKRMLNKGNFCRKVGKFHWANWKIFSAFTKPAAACGGG